MKLSIVIPALNEAPHIGPLVHHLRRHGGQALEEILVADGGSEDATREEAAAAGAQVLRCPQPGRARQMNLGARSARGDMLYFVHADTLPPASYVRDIRQAFAAGHEMGCYRSRYDSGIFLLKINAFFTRFPFLWCQGGDKTLYIPRTTFERLGGYDERYCVMEEYEWYERAAASGIRLHIMPGEVLISARKYEQRSWLQVQRANYTAFSLYRRGAAPEQIRDTYQRLLAPRTSP
ncbi:MAG: TIGR04283 family arsenosugar biosynthesis glycosyltransferase [Bacteroidia bacterium]|nr:TIGR04283 family arsenosugar biosynthesis glycosyltransferase [Bacteroidia bacterium]